MPRCCGSVPANRRPAYVSASLPLRSLKRSGTEPKRRLAVDIVLLSWFSQSVRQLGSPPRGQRKHSLGGVRLRSPRMCRYKQTIQQKQQRHPRACAAGLLAGQRGLWSKASLLSKLCRLQLNPRTGSGPARRWPRDDLQQEPPSLCRLSSSLLAGPLRGSRSQTWFGRGSAASLPAN